LTLNVAHWLYIVFALGAVGLYLLLPRRKSQGNRVGLALGALAVAALLVVPALRIGAPGGHNGYFCLFSAIALLASARVVTHTKPVYSALYFVLAVIAVACLLVLLEAEFLAVALIIIYAGAILVTYLFVIMLAQQSGAPIYDRTAREPLLAVAAGFALMAGISSQAAEQHASSRATPVVATAVGSVATPGIPTGNTATLGTVLMTRYVVATELAAVLLLISMVGAIALSKKQVPPEEPIPAPPLGLAGREVQPF